MKWVGMGLFALVFLIVLVGLVSRLAPVSAAQRQALELLEQPSPPPGHNGFTTMYLLPHPEIPEAQWDSVMAAHVAFINQRSRALEAADSEAEREALLDPAADPLSSHARGKFVRHCQWKVGGPTCLEQARADLEGFLATHGTNETQEVVRRIGLLADASHVRTPFEPNPAAPLPAMQWLFVSTEARAVAHLQGRSDEALAGVCQDIRSARLLVGASDNLLHGMVGVRWLEQSVVMLAQITAELPAGQALPAACEGALAPPSPTEGSLCAAAQGEFAMGRGVVGSVKANPLFSPEKTLGMMAPHQSWMCGEAALGSVAADTPVVVPERPESYYRFECVGNPIGCVLAGISGPAYDRYQHQAQDVPAWLRLAAMQQWLREQQSSRPGVPMQQLLDEAPVVLRSPARPFTLGEGGRWLEMQRYGRGDVETPLRIPLAVSGADTVAASPAR